MKILITGAWQHTEKERAEIEALGHSVIFAQQEKDELPCSPEEIEGVICNGLFLYHDISKFTNLQYIQLTSAGFDRVPMEEVGKRKIKINNARGVYSIPMAEFAIGGILNLFKQSGFFYSNQKNHSWEKHRSLLELNGKEVCIVGCGSVGNECAKRFGAFGCTVRGIDLYPRNDELYCSMQGLDRLKEAIATSDIVVLTLPLTEQTYHLFDIEAFSAMKNGSFIVNIARGAVIDQTALENALECNLAGAVLDVFEQEPLGESSSLWNKPNVIVTPHNSFVGDGNKKRLFDLILKNLEDHNENNRSCT